MMMMMSKEEVVEVVDDAGKISPEKLAREQMNSMVYGLYFKGLVSEKKNKKEEGSLSGFGVAICGQKDEVLFQIKGPIHGSDITVLEAELTALKRGLTEALDLQINHLSIYCDFYPLHELLMGRSVPKEDKIATLMNDVQRLRERFGSSFAIFVAGNSIKHAYKLARETIVSEISIHVDPPPPRQAKPIRKKTCPICLDDEVNAEDMFPVDKCRHRFCSDCMRRHIEVRLLEGSVLTCPQYRCKSRLFFVKCVDLLSPAVKKMWAQRIKEDSIPVVDRIYCPYPKCSALMSKTEISKAAYEDGLRRCCFKCGECFCLDCKVPWHDDLSCGDYKRLHPNATENDEKLKLLASLNLWRQCPKCQHMIELSQGCVRVNCRCGHKFCYRCGAGAGNCPHGHGLPPRPVTQTSTTQNAPPLCIALCLLCCIFGFLAVSYLMYCRE